MNNTPKVSIIVPVYNVEQYLERCVESLRNQTISDIEIILVDDESPDNCPQICDEYAMKDNRIKVVHKKNGGLGLARNSGLEIATGEYVAYVDSDDYVDCEMYEALYNNAKEKHTDIVLCGIKYLPNIGDPIDLIEVNHLLSLHDSDINSFILDMIASAPFVKKERIYEMSSCRAIYKREVIEKNSIRFRTEREVLSEDIIYNIDFLLKASSLVYIPHSYYYYCQNASSLSSTFLIEKFERSKLLYQIILNKMSHMSETPLRANRMFVVYSHSQILNLVSSSNKGKIKHLKRIISDPFFDIVKCQFKPEYLSSYHKYFFWLQIHKHSCLLYLFAKAIVIFKKSKFYHPYMTN